jgi:hypothetical protein
MGDARPGEETFTPIFIPKKPSSNGLVRFKMSSNFRKHLSPVACNRFKVFMIDKQGCISHHLIGLWKCNPYDLLATYVATSLKRIQSFFWKRLRKEHSSRYRQSFKKCEPLLVKMAIHLVLGDPSCSRRLWESLKRGKKALAACLAGYKTKMDEPSRFLYSHALSFAKWLQSRGNSRAQSISSFTRSCNIARVVTNPYDVVRSDIDQGIHSWSERFSLHGRIPESERIRMWLSTTRFSLFS